jgi:HEAT repeat protein
MWELIVMALSGAGGAALTGWHRRLRSRLQLWQEVAASCGLSEVESYSVWNLYLVLKAQAGLAGVWIGSYGKKTRVGIRFSGPPGFKELKISRETSAPAAREIEVGDEPFDRAFFVEGPVRLACALLDAETRRLLLSLNAEGHLAIAGERLEVVTSDSQLPRIFPLLLNLCRRFARPVDLEQHLADNAFRDPEPGVRLRNLLLLIREPGDARTIEVLRTACADASPQVRLRAAKELGAEGRDVLVGVAESTEDDACSAEAVSILGRALPFERARAILIQALRRRRLQTAQACLETLGRHGTAEAISALAKVMAREKGELAAAAAQALGMTESTLAEPSLIQALQREEIDLRVAVANALARVGSAAAVLPLKEAAERSEDGELRRAARQAIAEIQSRVQDASPGQLSLAGAEAGQLSLAQAEAGQLSLAAETTGQLSLRDAEEERELTPGGAA